MVDLWISCTDRGQHPRADLGNLEVADDGIRANVEEYFNSSHAGRRRFDAVVVDTEHEKVKILCPRCRRNPDWTFDTVRRLVAALEVHPPMPDDPGGPGFRWNPWVEVDISFTP